MLFYCPFELQEDRYSMQLSAPLTGWNEAAWRAKGVRYTRVEGDALPGDPTGGHTIFDLNRRSRWTLSQTIKLLDMISRGEITSQDILYFDDFLHPGIEAIGLAVQRCDRPKMYAWLHGTCFDPWDMLAMSKFWASHYERCVGSLLDGIFVACHDLKNLVLSNGVGKGSTVFATGHVWSTESVKAQHPFSTLGGRTDTVVYASRWDECKDPLFFLEVARGVKQSMDAEFVVCTSAPEMKSDRPFLLNVLKEAENEKLVTVLTGLSKKEYYSILASAKIVFSASRMDWISYVLLEGSAFGAYPVFPSTWSFLEALGGPCSEFLYPAGSRLDAVDKVRHVLRSQDLWTAKALKARSWIHTQYDSTWDRRLSAMGLGCGPKEI